MPQTTELNVEHIGVAARHLEAALGFQGQTTVSQALYAFRKGHVTAQERYDSDPKARRAIEDLLNALDLFTYGIDWPSVDAFYKECAKATRPVPSCDAHSCDCAEGEDCEANGAVKAEQSYEYLGRAIREAQLKLLRSKAECLKTEPRQLTVTINGKDVAIQESGPDWHLRTALAHRELLVDTAAAIAIQGKRLDENNALLDAANALLDANNAKLEGLCKIVEDALAERKAEDDDCFDTAVVGSQEFTVIYPDPDAVTKDGPDASGVERWVLPNLARVSIGSGLRADGEVVIVRKVEWRHRRENRMCVQVECVQRKED